VVDGRAKEEKRKLAALYDQRTTGESTTRLWGGLFTNGENGRNSGGKKWETENREFRDHDHVGGKQTGRRKRMQRETTFLDVAGLGGKLIEDSWGSVHEKG